jgi:hypothetical protein
MTADDSGARAGRSWRRAAAGLAWVLLGLAGAGLAYATLLLCEADAAGAAAVGVHRSSFDLAVLGSILSLLEIPWAIYLVCLGLAAALRARGDAFLALAPALAPATIEARLVATSAPWTGAATISVIVH